MDNRLKIDVGRSSAVTEEGPGNWNGVAGSLELRATDWVWIDAIYLYPSLARNTVRVKVRVRELDG